MEFSIQKLPKSETEIKIEISPLEFKGFLGKAFLSLGENLEIEGFRKGKAPREIIEKEVGKPPHLCIGVGVKQKFSIKRLKQLLKKVIAKLLRRIKLNLWANQMLKF